LSWSTKNFGFAGDEHEDQEEEEEEEDGWRRRMDVTRREEKDDSGKREAGGCTESQLQANLESKIKRCKRTCIPSASLLRLSKASCTTPERRLAMRVLSWLALIDWLRRSSTILNVSGLAPWIIIPVPVPPCSLWPLSASLRFTPCPEDMFATVARPPTPPKPPVFFANSSV
jgi:hypothetical protein